MKEEQPVEFFVYLKYEEDQAIVIQELERMVGESELDEVKFSKIMLPFGFGATTTQKTYETIFQTYLEYKDETLKSHNGKELTYKNWVESARAKVPNRLRNSIQHVSVSIPNNIYKKILREIKIA